MISRIYLTRIQQVPQLYNRRQRGILCKFDANERNVGIEMPVQGIFY